MRGPDAGIDDVRVYAGAVSVVDVAVRQRKVALIDAVESPGRGRLRLCRRDGDDAVLLDVADARIGGKHASRLRCHRDDKPCEHSLVHACHSEPVLHGHRLGEARDAHAGGRRSLVVQHDNELIGNGVFRGDDVGLLCERNALDEERCHDSDAQPGFHAPS